jgi:hypothetical protein
MIGFFTSVGFGASLGLLRRGGPLVIAFTIIASIVAAAQNVVGGLAAMAMDQHPLMGVLAGSVTLTGGPATGLAFAPLFEKAGVPAHRRWPLRPHGRHRRGRTPGRTDRHLSDRAASEEGRQSVSMARADDTSRISPSSNLPNRPSPCPRVRTSRPTASSSIWC